VPYQIVIFGSAKGAADATQVTSALTSTISARVADMGMNPKTDLAFPAPGNWNPRMPVAGVCLGGPSPTAADETAAADLLAAGAFVIPLVPTILNYTSQIPQALRGVNAMARDAADPDFELVAARLLEELRLLRSRRLVFISYKRSESKAVAQQLFRAFDARSFDVFLDTRSVQGGKAFQDVLWDRMSDSDLIVLLDSPKALDSKWVDKEVSRANEMGIGTLQIVWPGRNRSPGTDFAEALYLDPGDIGQPLSEDSELTAAMVNRIVTTAEAVRARSFAARRARVVTEFQKHAQERGLVANLIDPDMLTLNHPRHGNVLVFPIVGQPRSRHMHGAFVRVGQTKDMVLLLYDPLGFLPDTQQRLVWLSENLPTKALPTTQARNWMQA
jgi:hypothetical protein